MGSQEIAEDQMRSCETLAAQQAATAALSRRLAEKAEKEYPEKYVIFDKNEGTLGAAGSFLEAVRIYDQQTDKKGLSIMPPDNHDRVRMRQRTSIRETLTPTA